MKKWLSVVLALSMLFSLCASTVWATEGSGGSSAPASADVVYGSYKNRTWSQDANATGTIVTEDGLTLSKTAEKTGDNEYEITLKVVSSSKTTTSADKAATVLVIDRSASMTQTIKGCQLVEHEHGKSCYECTRQNNPSHWEKTSVLFFTYYTHTGNCRYDGWNGAYYADTILCGKTEHTHSSACQISRMSAAKNAALDFLDGFRDANGTAERWVAIVGFGTKVYDNAAWYNISTADGLTNAQNVVKALSAYSSSDGKGGTNLDAGLQKANTLLTDSRVQGIKSKSVVALTDGVPTYYGSGSSPTRAHGTVGCPENNKATATTAKSLSTKAGVYTVCLGAANDRTYTETRLIFSSCYHEKDGPTVGNFLMNSIASATKNAFTADDSDSLRKAFSDISTSVTSGLGDGKGWTVTDPMPDYITVTGDLPAGMEKTGENTYTWTLPQVTGVTNEETGVTTYTYEIKYTVEIKNTAGLDETKYHPTNKETILHYGTNNSQTAYFPVPGVKVVNAAYTITYKEGDHGTLYDVNGDVAVIQITFEKQKYGKPTPTLNEATQVKADDGYYFVGWNPAVADKVTGDMTYTAQYAKMGTVVVKPIDDETYYNGTVQESTKGYTVVGLPDGYELTDVPAVSGGGKDVVQNGGYELSIENRRSLAVQKVGSNEVDPAYRVTCDTGLLTINPLPITLTSETAEKVYDGKALTRPNVTVESDVPGGVDVFNREASVEATGAVTNVSDGTVYNSIAISTTNYKEANYAIKEKTGTLTIKPLQITLTSNDAEKVYDGKALTKDGVTVTSTNGNADVFKKELANLEAIGSVTNVMECQPKNNTISYTLNRNCRTDNYSIEVNPGSLIIKPMMVTLTSESASKEYDGKALTRPDVKVASSNGSPELFKSQVTGLKATGTITDPGTVDNTIVFTGNKEAKYQDDNYIVDRSTGTLTVTKKGVQPAPDVTVTKTVDKATAKKGDTLTYTITVTNNGKEDLANLTLKDVMFNDKTQKTDTTTSWTKVIDKLEAGKSQTFTYTYKAVKDDVNTKVINVVTVTDGGQLSATAQATTSVTGGGNGDGTGTGGNGGGTGTKTPVKSSSTGDMGIALYGAMALLSAGGMVWAGKKRRDER